LSFCHIADSEHCLYGLPSKSFILRDYFSHSRWHGIWGYERRLEKMAERPVVQTRVRSLSPPEFESCN
jgi:hypothetical protein